MPGGEQSGVKRTIVYCIVPRELASLHELLRRHFRDEPSVEVIVERRSRDRRRNDRRCGTEHSPSVERRRVLSRSGRRVAERRAALVVVERRPLPRRARAFAERLVFVESLQPSGLAAEEADTQRLVARIQAGDSEAFALLYVRYFERVYSYLRVMFKHSHDAEDAAQQVFIRVMEALPSYQPRATPFRAWLFTVVRNYALGELRRRGRAWPTEPSVLDRSREETQLAPVDEKVLGWLSDRDLLLFVERMPLAQRQVLVLRYLLDLPLSKIAEMLGRSHEDVRQLHARALGFLRDRLTSLGRTSQRRHSDKIRMRRVLTKMPVLRARRFSLTG